MASSSIEVVKTINHYKKSLEVPHVDEKRILHCIGVLYKLRVTVHLLQETGIGRTVNGLCKSDNGEVRTAAKSLVNKWKALVVNESEDEPARQSQEEDSAGVVAKHKDEGRMKKERSHQHHHRKISSKKDSDSKRDRDRGDEATESIRSDSKKSMDKHAHHKENNSHDRHGSSPEKKHESRKRSGEENKERSTKRQRAEGQHRSKRESEEDCEDTEIDGSAGTSFADALAMMDGGGGTTAKSSKSSSSGNPSKAPTSTAMSNSTRRSDPATHTKGTTSDNSSRLASSSSSAGYSKVEAKAGGSRSSRPSDSGSGPPKLLAPSTKLAPLLDPEELKKDILGPSVVISNSYTPTSYLNPVNIAGVSASIMKNKRPVGQPPPPVVDSNNFEILQSKARTKVYSGNKGAAVVLSLHEMCIRVLQKNVDALEYTGGVPYDILEPILLKCSASQLDQIEYYNPYLGEDTNDLWKIHTQRQFRGKKRQEMESWREMYQRCQQEEQERLSRLTESIKQTQQTSIPVKQTKMAYMDRAQVPPMGRRRGTGGGGGGPSINASLANRASVNGTRMGFLTAGREVQAKRAPLMQKTLALMKKAIKR